MPDSIINCEDCSSADVVLIGAGYDLTSSFGKGSNHGPSAVRACLDTQIEFFDRLSGTNPVEHKQIAWLDLGDLGALSPEEMVCALEKAYSLIPGKFPVLIGGEHSVSNGPFRHFREDAANITILQIDAHADLREDDSDYNDTPHGRFAHCAVMKRGFDLGYQLVQVGLRAFSSQEQRLFSDPRVRAFEWGPRQPEVREILSAIRTRKVYLTIDVDGFDPSVMPATGTPVPGGLSWYYGQELIKALFEKHEVIGADVVEVCPRQADALTEYCAAQLAYSIIGCKFA